MSAAAFRLHRVGRWFVSLRTPGGFLLFGIACRNGLTFFGQLPGRPMTRRYRVGPFEIESTRATEKKEPQ